MSFAVIFLTLGKTRVLIETGDRNEARPGVDKDLL